MHRRRPPSHLPDAERERHPSWRRYTRKYQRKRKIVRDLWIASGLLTLGMGAPLGGALIMLLGTTCLSFVILDETA